MKKTDINSVNNTGRSSGILSQNLDLSKDGMKTDALCEQSSETVS